MVEYNLDLIYHSFADVTRRDIMRRVAEAELSISTLAAEYDMSFAAVAKHLNVLAKAQLIIKRRQGTRQLVAANPEAITEATRHLEEYKRMWNERFDSLDELLKEEK